MDYTDNELKDELISFLELSADKVFTETLGTAEKTLDKFKADALASGSPTSKDLHEDLRTWEPTVGDDFLKVEKTRNKLNKLIGL